MGAVSAGRAVRAGVGGERARSGGLAGEERLEEAEEAALVALDVRDFLVLVPVRVLAGCCAVALLSCVARDGLSLLLLGRVLGSQRWHHGLPRREVAFELFLPHIRVRYERDWARDFPQAGADIIAVISALPFLLFRRL